MSDISQLYANPGDRVADKWRALINWIRRQRHQAPGATINYGPGGAKVIFDPPPYAQNTRFQVYLVGDAVVKVRVNEGTINGKVPEYKGVPIIGRTDPLTPPPEIDATGPDDNLESIVCIKTSHKPNGDLEKAEIECKRAVEIPNFWRADYAVRKGEGGQWNGFIPIAILRHDRITRQPRLVHQHVVHNLQCRMYMAGSARRILYWPA